jgi:hypothetical protein
MAEGAREMQAGAKEGLFERFLKPAEWIMGRILGDTLSISFRSPGSDPIGIAPPQVIEEEDFVNTGAGIFTTVAVTNWPTELNHEHLAYLRTFKGYGILSVHIRPISDDAAKKATGRKIKEYEAKIAQLRKDNPHDRIEDLDPKIAEAINDAMDMKKMIDVHHQKLASVRVYFGFYSKNLEERKGFVGDVQTSLHSVGCEGTIPVGQSLDAMHAVGPFCKDKIFTAPRNEWVSTAAALFPFAPRLNPRQRGFFFGKAKASGTPHFVDYFDTASGCEAGHMAVFGGSGAGKTTTLQLLIHRGLIYGNQFIAVETEENFGNHCLDHGGSVIRLAPESENVINLCQRHVIGGRIEPIPTCVERMEAVLEMLLDDAAEKQDKAIWREIVNDVYQAKLTAGEAFKRSLGLDRVPEPPPADNNNSEVAAIYQKARDTWMNELFQQVVAKHPGIGAEEAKYMVEAMAAEADKSWVRYYEAVGAVYLQEFYDRLSERGEDTSEIQATRERIHNIKGMLAPYVTRRQGERAIPGDQAFFFDRPTNVTIDNPYTLFDLCAYQTVGKSKDPRLALMMFAVFALVRLYLSQSSRNQTKIFIFDEIQNILPYPTVSELIFSTFTTYRNKSAGIWIATQNIGAIVARQAAGLDSDQRRAYAATILLNCPRKLFLKHDPEAAQCIREFFDKQPLPEESLRFITEQCQVEKDGLPYCITGLLIESREHIKTEIHVLPGELKYEYAANQGALAHQAKLREATENNY